MTQKVFTFREAAEAFCALDGRPDSDVTAVYLQVKGLYDRGLMAALPERAARGAHQITLAEACRARLLIVLVDLGIQSDELAQHNAMLDHGKSLDKLLKATKAGEQWVMRVSRGRDRLDAGALKSSVKLLPRAIAARPSNEEHSEGDPTHPDSKAVVLGFTYLAYTKIPASELVAPLLKDSDA